MDKIIYLLPPSEWKTSWGDFSEESTTFSLVKPSDIAIHTTPKDLKCQGKRYEEGNTLNTSLCHGIQTAFLPAIQRYSGVMYNAIDYPWLSPSWKKYFDTHFYILSGMYGIVSPWDTIWNYKLPIETKWLYAYWGTQITDILNTLKPDIVVNLLPWSYAKMIDWNILQAHVVHIDFFTEKNGERKKMTHGVKKVKGSYIHNLCETRDTRDVSNNSSSLEIIISDF